MEKASFNVFLVTIVLGILAYVSPTFIPFPALKTAIIGIGVLAAFILFVISRIKEKSINFPWSSFVVVGVLLGVSAVVSSLYSLSPAASFIGKSFGDDSGLFLIIILIAGLLGTMLVQTRDRIFTVYMTIAGSFALVALFQLIRIAFPGFLSFGLLTTSTSTVVGTWYDLGFFAGIALIISLLTLEFVPAAKRLRMLFVIIFILAAIILIIVNSPLAWFALALIAVGISAVKYFHPSTKEKTGSFLKKLPLFPIIVLVVAVVFTFWGTTLTAPLTAHLNTDYVDNSIPALPWQSTVAVSASTLQAVPLWGAGPDRFVNAYLQFKPQVINTTPFWSIPFASGYSFLLTTIATQGIVGFILWTLFIVLFFILGVRAFKVHVADHYARYTLSTSFFAAAFLWIMNIIFVPSHALLFLTLVFTGLFVGELIGTGHMKVKTLDWSGGIKGQLFLMIGLGLIIAVAAFGAIVYAKDMVAQIYLQNGVQTINNASSTESDAAIAAANQAKHLFQTSLFWSKTDATYQAIAQTDLYIVNAMVAAATSTTPDAGFGASVTNLLTDAVNNAHLAELADEGNYYNDITEANVFETAAGLQVPNAYSNARNAYSKAVTVSPYDPSIYLDAAKLDYFAGSTTLAFNELNAALQLRPTYTDALFEAGVISYQTKDYQTAGQMFSQVLSDDSSYADAAYFLGLTYIRLNDNKDALTEFNALAQAYPDNQQVQFVLDALKAGRSPFSDASVSSEPNLQPTAAVATSTPAVATSTAKSTKTAH